MEISRLCRISVHLEQSNLDHLDLINLWRWMKRSFLKQSYLPLFLWVSVLFVCILYVIVLKEVFSTKNYAVQTVAVLQKIQLLHSACDRTQGSCHYHEILSSNGSYVSKASAVICYRTQASFHVAQAAGIRVLPRLQSGA
jgi:hypothetical protein